MEAIPKFRDLLEYHINKSQSLGSGNSIELILEKVKKEIRSFAETMKKINEEYEAKDLETRNNEPLLADEDFGGNDHVVRVYDKELLQINNELRGLSWKIKIISVVGMAGIGTTTIVKVLYNKPVISDHFDLRAFIRVGSTYHLKNILLDFLVCLPPNYNKILGKEMSEDELGKQITELCLVKDDFSGSRIIITTRLSSMALYCSTRFDVHKIRFRNEDESWNLFCKIKFLPLGFVKVGKKIVKKYGGLPLGIISIANILSKVEKSLDYWEMVAKDKNLLALTIVEGSPMSKTLFLSYKNLPPHLKECCLYIGLFPLNHDISVSKLVKLWVGEGLVQPKHFKTFEDTARKYLEDLVSHNIVSIRQRSSNGRVKTLTTHFFWHLWVREAANKKIFHLINSCPNAFSEGIHCQRRLCIRHKNALLGFKRVSESIESVLNVRSFLYAGPEHQYPVSTCSGLTCIKVLDALTIRLYEFPIGILELVELKYLAFTYDGKLHSSISRLKNLVYLIVHRYHQTIINSSSSNMPIEIWNMQELRHLQVMGSDLPHPVDGAHLPNLLTLLGVSDRSCTKEVLQSIPNLEKLGVLPQCVFETLHIFNHLAMLSKLKSFKCIVSNPNQQVLLLSKLVFPSSLTKLTLSGCEDMPMIGALINLRVLKLLCCAFQGLEWVVDRKEFPKLEYLLLEDTNLVKWRIGYGFPQLKRLIIRHCYKLKEIPYELGYFIPEAMDLVDCSLASAKHILEQRERDKYKFPLRVYFSLDDEKH